MKVKLCGMTHPEDAAHAARLGADYIGIIFAQQSKRRVTVPDAKKLADAAFQAGAEPVGVFVDETIDQIVLTCRQTGITTVQLHGEKSQQDFDLLLDRFTIIYSFPVESNGSILHERELPSSVLGLYDNKKGGTGVPFDWKCFSPPHDRQWILAGGLNPGNVAEAIDLLNPYGVDAATGVEFPNSTRKDPILMQTFIQNAKQAKERI